MLGPRPPFWHFRELYIRLADEGIQPGHLGHVVLNEGRNKLRVRFDEHPKLWLVPVRSVRVPDLLEQIEIATR